MLLEHISPQESQLLPRVLETRPSPGQSSPTETRIQQSGFEEPDRAPDLGHLYWQSLILIPAGCCEEMQSFSSHQVPIMTRSVTSLQNNCPLEFSQPQIAEDLGIPSELDSQRRIQHRQRVFQPIATTGILQLATLWIGLNGLKRHKTKEVH